MIQREPVSIICVSNNHEVLARCLQASVLAGQDQAPETELIVMENSRNEFATAGEALNKGILSARNKVCVMVHQDVYLHSLPHLEQAAALLLADRGLGLMGAIGITDSGQLVGEIRDRLLLTGTPVRGVQDVDSLDEVLFMATRQQLVDDPLSEDPVLAWHAYAVEFGARQRRAGRRVVAADLPLTHNSLTINLDRLSEAHEHVARLYPEFPAITTTCGVIRASSPRRLPAGLDAHRWKWRWLRNSLALLRHKPTCSPADVLLSDIRFTIDSVLSSARISSLSVINLTGPHVPAHVAALTLPRLGRELSFRTLPETCLGQLAQMAPEDSVLVTNMECANVAVVQQVLAGRPRRHGWDPAIGHWLLCGPVTAAFPEEFSRPPVRALALR